MRNFRVKYQESSIGFENLANLQFIENKCNMSLLMFLVLVNLRSVPGSIGLQKTYWTYNTITSEALTGFEKYNGTPFRQLQ